MPMTGADPEQAVSEELLAHCRMIANAFADGEIVPFLGAGANLCGRPKGESWKFGEYLPSGSELSEYLALRSGYPLPDRDNLVRVSQYQATMQGDGPLYKRLREIFDADYKPTSLHKLLAGLPKTLEVEYGKVRYQLIVTTNYDNALECAFEEAGQPFDLFTYIAFGEDQGKFLYKAPNEKSRIVANPKRFIEPMLERRPAILKIHGAVDRIDETHDSYVITEDDYLDFLQRTEISNLVPITLIERLQNCHFLFLGYSLKDWNLRVMLQRIWDQQKLGWSSWAVQQETTLLDQRFWMKRGVDIQIVDLMVYVQFLDDALRVVAAERRQQ